MRKTEQQDWRCSSVVQHLPREHKASKLCPQQQQKDKQMFSDSHHWPSAQGLVVKILQTELHIMEIYSCQPYITGVCPSSHFSNNTLSSAIPHSSWEPPCRGAKDCHFDFDLWRKVTAEAKFRSLVTLPWKDACHTIHFGCFGGIPVLWQDCPT